MSTLRLTVSSPAAPVSTDLGTGDVAVTDRYVSVAGEPVFLVSGEIHFSRLPRAQWAATLAAARAGGLTHVASYVLWNHHEPRRGDISFAGDLDIRHFLELAVDAGLGVVLRIGPYAHAESRFGGLPSWLVETGVPVRTDDPRYLAEAERWYRLLAEQVADIPLFAIQVDNELYDRPDHLATLRALAERVGFSAPLWMATAWGGAEVPAGVLPMYGGYSDSFWIEASDTRDERSASNFYPSARRDDDGIGADHREATGAGVTDATATPFATCELGGGMVSAYHRRPVVTGADVEALALAKLASGSVWQGYYMYSDGRNPRRHLQENHADGDPNDFLDIGYDFGGPLTLDGRPRDAWFRLRRQHQLLARWGASLAEMPAVFPDDAADAPDVTRLRWSVRSDGDSGFLFVVNHQPHVDLPAHDGVRFAITRERGDVAFPAVDIPTGASFVWPFSLRVGEVEITWATAQPLTEVTWRGVPLLVLSEIAGIPAAFETDVVAREIEMIGPGRWWELRRDGRADAAILAHVLILDDTDSLRMQVADDGAVILSDGSVEGDLVRLHHSGEVIGLGESGWQSLAAAAIDPEPVPLSVVRTGGTPEPIIANGIGRASVPADWSAAMLVDLEVPDDDRTLVVEWQGDVARAWDGDRLVSDAIWNGREWRIPGALRGRARGIRVEILPVREDAPVFFGAGRPDAAGVTAASLEASALVRIEW